MDKSGQNIPGRKLQVLTDQQLLDKMIYNIIDNYSNTRAF
jgi:hypothetical protein